MKSRFKKTLLAGAILCAGSPFAAHAVLIGGVEFPQGAVSFVDAVVSYTPVISGGNPTDPHRGAFNALGVPNYAGASCASQAACTFVTLGQGGSIVLRFVDNLLTGNGTSADDLWIFEIGPDVEDTFVDISTDGINWNPVGKVFGSTAGVNIDAFGFGIGSTFAYVRLTDDPNEGSGAGATGGADIDAVGAISTTPVDIDIPEPATLGLLALGFLGLVSVRRRIG